MGLLSFFREVHEEDDRITIRSMSGLSFFGMVLFFSGIVVALICLPVAYIATGSDQTDLAIVGFGSLAGALLGVVMRLAGPKKRVDYRSREIIENQTVYPFSGLAFVSITERTQVIRTQNNRIRVPHFNVLLGFGSLDPRYLQERLEEIRSIDVGDDFIAGESRLDEETVDQFFIDNDLRALRLFDSGGYPTLFRTAHRLAKAANVPLLNLTGSSFSVASGDELDVPFHRRDVAPREVSDELADDEESNVESGMKPQGFEIVWNYPLWLATLGTIVIGFGSAAFGYFLFEADPDIAGGAIYMALGFGIPTLLIVIWLLTLTGKHRIIIDGRSIRYARPVGAEKSLPLDELIDVYVRPNLSGGMSAMMLLSDHEVVVLRGRLPELKAVDRSIRAHFASAQAA